MGVVCSCPREEAEVELTESPTIIHVESLTVEDVEGRESLALDKVKALGHEFCHSTNEFSASTLFLCKLVRYKFLIKKPVKGLKLIQGKDFDPDSHSQAVVDEAFDDQPFRDRVHKDTSLGDYAPAVQPYEYSHEFYLPENLSDRILYYYVVDQNNILLAKAKVFITKKKEFERKHIMEKTMHERDERLQSMVSHVKAKSSMDMYDKAELLQAMGHVREMEKSECRYIIASDDILLAYRLYQPRTPHTDCANIVFVTIDSFFLDILAEKLACEHGVNVYVCELRGFGYSGGKRGVAASRERIWEDTRSFVRHVRNNTHKPVYLMAYFMSGSLVLNYGTWKDREPVDGYIMLAPNLGSRASGAEGKSSHKLQEKSIKVHGPSYTLAKITGGRIAGKQPAVSMSMPDAAYTMNPMFVDVISGNTMLALMPTSPGHQFGRLDKPLLFLVGSNDEFFDGEALASYARHCTVGRSVVRVVEGCTNIGLLMKADGHVAEWLKTLPEVQSWLSPNRVSSESPPIELKASTKSTSAAGGGFLEDVTKAVVQSLHAGMFKAPTMFLEAFDGELLAYQVFTPPEDIKSIANFVFFGPTEFAFILPKIAANYAITCFRFDLRGLGRSTGARSYVHSRKEPWTDVRTCIRFVKANWPAEPIFAGGPAFVGALVVNYSSWSDTEPVNAYVFISPIPHPEKPGNAAIVKEPLKELFQFPEKPGLFSRSWFKSSKVDPKKRGRLSVDLHTVSTSLIKEFSPKFLESLLPEDLVQQITAIEKPVILFVPGGDPMIRGEVIAEALNKVLVPPFHKVKLIEDTTIFGILQHVADEIGPWIEEVASAIALRAGPTLENITLKDFEVIEMVGKGTFGKVYLVKHNATRRYLAMKVLEKSTIVGSGHVHQVQNERRILSECQSPFIVPFVGSFQDKSRLYILMEFLVGGELFTHLNVNGRMSNEDGKFYAAEVLLAIEYLHSHGIIYRDLKPENILIDQLGHLRLIDFGFAKKYDGRCRSFCGSPYYIPPEMLTTSSYEISVDFWSYGVCVYEMLAGVPPFSGRYANEVYRQIVLGKIQYPSFLHEDARDLLIRLLDPDPSTRLGSGAKGMDEIKYHRWFKGIDWERLAMRTIQTPFQPRFGFEGDTANFVKYTGEDASLGKVSEDNLLYDSLFYDGLFTEF